MAITTSSHLNESATLDHKYPPKMASLKDEQAPTSNGINGHSYSTTTSLNPTIGLDALGGTAAPITDSSDAADVANNSAKNAEALAANDRLPLQHPPALSASGIDVNEAQEARQDESDGKPPSEQLPAPAASEHDADKATTAGEDDVDLVKEEPSSADNNGVGKVAKEAKSEDAQPPTESEPQDAVHEPAHEQPAAEVAPPAKDATADESKEDFKMSDAIVDTHSTSQGSSLGNVPKDTVSSDAVIVTAHAHTISSSLLPSLRDDGSREQTSGSANTDTAMADAPSTKVARVREDDNGNERSAKRARTEDAEVPTASQAVRANATPSMAEMQIDWPPAVLPPRVRFATKEGSLADPKLDESPISPYANREIRRVLASVKKTKVGINFKDPMHKKWPLLWDSYIARVAKPMDIGQMERHLRENAYGTHADFINDLFLIYENSVSFNGAAHPVSEEAKSLVDNFFARLSDISAREPQKSDKKDPKQLPTRQTGPRAAASRRESRGAATSPIEESVTAVSASPLAVSTATGVATSSVVDASHVEATTPVFAVPSSGVPIIRRDSAKTDGDRPKRPIHPPKNRDLGYEPKNPKKKQPEFRFCEEVLKELVKAKHYETNHWFLKPVDAVAMQIPTYHKIIKKPMDLGTMQTKLNLGEYVSPKEFENDLNLIIKNCRKFNVVGEVVDSANRLEELFKLKWAEKDAWVASHTSAHSGSASVLSPTGGLKDGYSDDELDESDAEGDEISVAPMTSDTVDALVKRLEEENVRLNSLLMAKIPDMTMITTQQVVLNMIQKQIVEEKTKLAAADVDKRSKKPSKSKSARGKKAAAGAGATKKAAGNVASGGVKKTIGVLTKKAPKARVLGQAEKNVVTDGINNLEGQQLERAIEIIKKDTNQEESESGELELDIDQLSQDALGKLYDLIIKAFPHLRVKTEKSRAGGEAAVGKPSKPKKHKPMGKLEQERNIEKLREIKAQFQRPGSGSQEPLPSVEVSQTVGEEESEEESDVDSEEE